MPAVDVDLRSSAAVHPVDVPAALEHEAIWVGRGAIRVEIDPGVPRGVLRVISGDGSARWFDVPADPHDFVRGPAGPNRAWGPPEETCVACGRDPRNRRHQRDAPDQRARFDGLTPAECLARLETARRDGSVADLTDAQRAVAQALLRELVRLERDRRALILNNGRPSAMSADADADGGEAQARDAQSRWVPRDGDLVEPEEPLIAHGAGPARPRRILRDAYLKARGRGEPR